MRGDLHQVGSWTGPRDSLDLRGQRDIHCLDKCIISKQFSSQVCRVKCIYCIFRVEKSWREKKILLGIFRIRKGGGEYIVILQGTLLKMVLGVYKIVVAQQHVRWQTFLLVFFKLWILMNKYRRVKIITYKSVIKIWNSY
jgi:hypothetical protein